jgi:crotonobetainyl-CoA:carnitine CoA-transferase CaiB-like acyl-CoA transferase
MSTRYKSEFQANGDPSAGSLSGIRVIEFDHFRAGPMASLILDDMGAEVLWN